MYAVLVRVEKIGNKNGNNHSACGVIGHDGEHEAIDLWPIVASHANVRLVAGAIKTVNRSLSASTR